MFNYEKRLEYPIHIKETNPKLAKAILTQYGGPDGELGASMRYLSQRYTMPYAEAKGVLTDIGVEELAPSRYLYLTTSLFSASPNKKRLPRRPRQTSEEAFSRLIQFTFSRRPP